MNPPPNFEFAAGPARAYPCPQCGTKNSGTEHEVRRGLKCSQCGIGYIPVKIETRGFEQREKLPAGFLGGLAVVMIALMVLFGFISFWLVWATVIVGLLAGILIALKSKS